jgi:hypothetical protein
MSDNQPLSDLLASPRSDILPGYILSPFTLDLIAQAEFEFARKHLEIVAGAASMAIDRIAKLMLQIANNEIANKQFVWGGNGFRLASFAETNLPFLLWLTLQEKHPQVTVEQASDLLPKGETKQAKEKRGKIHQGVLELLGYDFSTVNDDKKKKPGNQNQSTGGPLSPPSEKQESQDAKSPE